MTFRKAKFGTLRLTYQNGETRRVNVTEELSRGLWSPRASAAIGEFIRQHSIGTAANPVIRAVAYYKGNEVAKWEAMQTNPKRRRINLHREQEKAYRKNGVYIDIDVDSHNLPGRGENVFRNPLSPYTRGGKARRVVIHENKFKVARMLADAGIPFLYVRESRDGKTTIGDVPRQHIEALYQFFERHPEVQARFAKLEKNPRRRPHRNPKQREKWMDEFVIGSRVEISPGFDAWMRGDRYGTIIKKGSKTLHVRLDKSGRILRIGRPTGIYQTLETAPMLNPRRRSHKEPARVLAYRRKTRPGRIMKRKTFAEIERKAAKRYHSKARGKAAAGRAYWRTAEAKARRATRKNPSPNHPTYHVQMERAGRWHSIAMFRNIKQARDYGRALMRQHPRARLRLWWK